MYEVYKDIPGYEGLYKISRTGDIVSFNSGKGKPRLRAHSIHVDRHFIILSRDGINKRFPVANLVAETFGLPNPNGYKTIAFKDGNFHNLNLDNLEWAPLGKARKEISAEARARQVETRKKNGFKPPDSTFNVIRRKVAAYNDEGNWVATFRSVADAQRIVGGSIGQALIHGCHAGGYYWKYVEDEKTML